MEGSSSRSKRPPPIVLPSYNSSLPSYPNTLGRGTPFADTNYFPFPSASLKAPKSLDSTAIQNDHSLGRFFANRGKALLVNRAVWLTVILLVMTSWYYYGEIANFQAVKPTSTSLGKGSFGPSFMDGLQFFPANNPKIHVCVIILLWSSC
jgi:hypothetical protein